MTDVFKMNAASWYWTSLGRAASFLSDELPADLTDPKSMRGQMVEIDGVLFRVKAVETVASNYDPDVRHKHAFGLLLEPV